jgi:DNA-binding CsgD family transcriptional regulator
MGTIERLGPVRVARAESAWLAGDRERTLEEACAVQDLALNKQHPWFAAELTFWRWRAGDAVTVTEWMAQPIVMHISGDWRGAAHIWEQIGCPYEQAAALADGDSESQIAALKLFEKLGARPAAQLLRQKLQTAGKISLPRQPRGSTRANPFGLTHRQVEILSLLTERLSNIEIAARLHISVKTADHHVSAILEKLEVHSREAAAALARQHPHFLD